MSIRVVCGHIGQGKTLYAMSLIEAACKAGRSVYTNIKLTEGCPHFAEVSLCDDEDFLVCGKFPEPPAGLVERDPVRAERLGRRAGKYQAFWHYCLPGSVVVIDEADWYFDCTDHSQMARDVKQFHKQVRKLGIDIVYVVQHVPNLYVRIRRLATSFVVCEWNFRTSRMFQYFPVGWSRFLRSEFSSDDFSPRSHMGDGYWSYAEGAKYFSWFSTNQMLGDVSFYRAETLAYLGLSGSDGDGQSGSLGEAERVSEFSDGTRGGSAAAAAEASGPAYCCACGGRRGPDIGDGSGLLALGEPVARLESLVGPSITFLPGKGPTGE